MDSYIEIYMNDTLLELPDGEVVPLNKQANAIGELSIRKSDFSREFRVKRTRAMNELFENAGIISSNSNIPYQKNNIQCYFNGIDVFKSGKLNLLRADTYYFYCNIYSGIKDIFNELGKLTLNDLDLSDLEHTLDIATMKASLENDLEYKYLLFEPSDDGGLVPDSGNFEVAGEVMRCFISAKRLFNQIFIDYEINIKNDIENDALFNRVYIVLSNSETDKYNTSNLLNEFTNGYVSLVKNIRTKIPTIAINDPIGIGFYTAKYTGKYYFLFNLSNFDPSYTVDVDINSVQTAISTTSYVEGFLLYFSFSIDLVAGDTMDIYVTYIGLASAISYNANSLNFYCTNIDSLSIAYSSLVSPELHLPPMKQTDYIKSIMLFFGLVVDYDNITNTLRFWKINNVLDNKHRAFDWSKYLHVDDSELTYTIDGYAQKNLLKWKSDDDVASGQNESYITVLDETLEKEKTQFEMPFATTNEVVHQAEYMSIISWYKSIEGSANYKEEKKITERMVTCENLDTSIDVVFTHGASSETVSAANAFKARSLPLHLLNSLGYYQTISRINTKAKVIKQKFNLPAKAYNEFTHEIPIYLDQYGEYFYVNKISNYVTGKLCEAELYRIY